MQERRRLKARSKLPRGISITARLKRIGKLANLIVEDTKTFFRKKMWNLAVTMFNDEQDLNGKMPKLFCFTKVFKCQHIELIPINSNSFVKHPIQPSPCSGKQKHSKAVSHIHLFIFPNIKWLALITKWVFMILWWCRMGLFTSHIHFPLLSAHCWIRKLIKLVKIIIGDRQQH